MVLAVTTPVRWLERLLRNEGAPHTAVHQDPELTMVEDATVLVGSTLAVGITLWHWAEGHIAARLVRR